jgi:hypothetical protein
MGTVEYDLAAREAKAKDGARCEYLVDTPCLLHGNGLIAILAGEHCFGRLGTSRKVRRYCQGYVAKGCCMWLAHRFSNDSFAFCLKNSNNKIDGNCHDLKESSGCVDHT